MSLPDIRKAIIELDDDKLSIDDLRAMSRYLPTREEVSYHCCTDSIRYLIECGRQAARIKEHDDVGKLAKADQYLSQVRAELSSII